MNRNFSGLLILLLAAAPFMGSCGDEPYYRAHEKKRWPMYQPPLEATEEQVVSKEEIVTYVSDPQKATLLGFIEKVEVTFEGTREPRTLYRIYNRHHAMVGHATADGIFYRYDPDGREKYMGPYPVTTTGLRVLFGLSVSDKLAMRPLGY